jgi:sugar O-acyltransferase (sialic acid O-acetyltransferase NeuD family)
MSVRQIVVWGATGHAKVVNEALRGTGMTIVALVDNRLVTPPISGVPVLKGEIGLSEWLREAQQDRRSMGFVVAVGGDKGPDRLELYETMERLGLTPITIVHRASFVAGDAKLEVGCQVLAGAVIATHAHIGRAAIVNTSASVDHDSIVGSGAHIGPGATLAGEVTVGSGAFIGAGATVLPRIRVGDGAVVGAGAVVTSDVPPRSTVVGVPAKIRAERN